ncbi:Oligopeptide ABC transporter, periplasmic oligopeptide-binding protein OppA [Pseudonocardia sp. Ae406_Ps2]|uniref:ABC transporter family substrate-binding protein n=1 Tax=unclassified Pseudonocardia TaxID=2619320 RepID=UPI00094B5BAB|nr:MULTISPECIES: ABC transporter family substrate-binding protein [unclassified Pseudonocardia]OLM02077.1 Oligopeptide ABC transporter, periplasmic oligopeptide-binding protein OppA [Pseudonocardia sp. Ae406_Ps2]OLM06140.1 Oligopeptide ABC transporter, periplasmic oligopeptide-binding protein OppA [Pseudonocardia sp. Ae331_Ps2]OLM23650.1 Oligopeptide ABC transporter, periplasmic oligopeptide-binding protein OppA [Pseudonocardia sp. Ae706_Ps2]
MRRPIRRGATTAAVAALALVLAGCGGGGSGGPAQTAESLSTTPSYNAQPYENVKDGGQVTLPFRSDLNPQFNQFQGDMTTDTRLAWGFYNPMVITFTPTGEPVINPDYVTKADTVDNGGKTTVTYTINPKAVFNDGTPIDWRAFESTWKANNGKDSAFIPNSTDGYDRITSVTRGADDKQAVVAFNGPNPWWQGLFNNLLHPKAATPDVFNKGYLNNPHPEWGAGPYVLSNFDKQNSTLTFERNPKWWGKKGKLDRITLVQMETQAKVNAFRNGQIDAAEAETADLLAQARSVPNADIRISGTPANFLLTLNSTTPVLKDPAVRKAVFDAIDRTQLAKIAFQGLDYTEDPGGSLVLQPYQKGYEDNLAAAVAFDPERAKQGLDAAGWVAGPDGVRTKGGQPLTFTYVQTGDTPTKRASSGAMVAMLKNIGVDLKVRVVPSTDFSKVMANKEFDMVFSGFKSSDPYGVAYICQQYCSDSTLNKSGTGTGTAALDEELRKVNTLPTADEQYAAANAVEKKAFATYGLLPVYSGPAIWATKPGLANWGASLFAFNPLPETLGWQNGS